MTNNNATVEIEKLGKENYQPWKFKMSNYLMGKDLWGYVPDEKTKLELPLKKCDTR